MKLINPLQAPSTHPRGSLQMQQIWVCLLALSVSALPRATASDLKIASQRQRTAEALSPYVQKALSKPPPEEGLTALPGGGGGLDVLRDPDKMDDDKKNDIYRPWKTRFDLQPFDFTNPDFANRPENRLGYRKFYASHPMSALAPNSRDREAESTVLLAFGLTAIGTILGGMIIIYETQVQDINGLSLASYQRKMLGVIGCSALPWLLLGGWLLGIFLTFVSHSQRYPEQLKYQSWQCDAMVWYLLVAPAINVLYFTSHALWASRLFFKVEQQAPMGRMLNLSVIEDEKAGSDASSHIFNIACNPLIRYTLVVLEAAAAVFGYLLITFRWGANSQFCQPEVYWATTALVVTVSIAIVFSALAFICSICVGSSSRSPWIQDFVESFYEAELLSKMARHEKEEERMAARANAAAIEQYQFEEWSMHVDEHEEARRRHEESMRAHDEYLAVTSEKPLTWDQSRAAGVLMPSIYEIPDDRSEPLASIPDDRSEPQAPEERSPFSEAAPAPWLPQGSCEPRNVARPTGVTTWVVQGDPGVPYSKQVVQNVPDYMGEIEEEEEDDGSPMGRIDASGSSGQASTPFGATMPPGFFQSGQFSGVTSTPFGSTMPPGFFEGPPDILPPSSLRAPPPTMPLDILHQGSFQGPPPTAPFGSFQGSLPMMPGSLPFGASQGPSSFQGAQMPPGSVPFPGSIPMMPGSMPPGSVPFPGSMPMMPGSLPPGSVPFPGSMPMMAGSMPFPPGTLAPSSFQGAQMQMPPGTLPPTTFREPPMLRPDDVPVMYAGLDSSPIRIRDVKRVRSPTR